MMTCDTVTQCQDWVHAYHTYYIDQDINKTAPPSRASANTLKLCPSGTATDRVAGMVPLHGAAQMHGIVLTL